MKVILLDKLGKLGNLGDQVTVKSGYGRNYLLPYGKAIAATKENVVIFEERRAELEKAAADKLTVAQGRKRQLEEIESVTITANAGEEGKLFGSIGTRNLAQAISDAGLAVEKSEINLPEGAIRQTGSYDIDVQFYDDVTATINIQVVPE